MNNYVAPNHKSHVKILLRNNATVEGIVKNWYANVVELQSLDEQSCIIIPHPEEDIILIKVFLNNSSEEKISSNSENPQNELEQKFQQTLEQPSDDPDRIQSLAELRILLSQQERQILTNKLRQHHLGETKKVEYGHPGFLPKPRPQ